MPTFHVDLVTDRGTQRIPFTFDGDRPLGAQVGHVLEELRQQGIVLRGGPEDELAIVWNGRTMNPGQTPDAQGLTPFYPIELRMRRRAAPREAAPRRTEPVAVPFLPKHGYLSPVAGVTGGAVAWLLAATLLVDLPGLLPSYGALDLAVAVLLGGMIGGLVLAADATRRAGSAGLGLLTGLCLGALGAAIGGVLGGLASGAVGFNVSRQGFLLSRMAFWTLTSGVAGLFIGLAAVRRDRRRPLDGLLYGLAVGLFGGLLVSLPGRTDLWQLLGFLVVGLGIGAGYAWPALRRAAGVLELERAGDRSVGLLRHRGWELPAAGVSSIGGLFEVRTQGGRAQLVPTGAGAGSARLAGQPLAGAAELLNQDELVVGDRVFRFRRFPENRL